MLATARSKIVSRQKVEDSDRMRNGSALSNHDDSSTATPLGHYGSTNDAGKATIPNYEDSKYEGSILKSGPTIKEIDSDGNEKTFSNWFGKKTLAGAGLQYKFTNFDNRLIRWILEKHGFKESV